MRSFVDSNGFTVEFESVHDFACVVGVGFGLKFGKSVALVRLSDAVFGEMEVDEGARLNHEFPDDGVGGSVVDVANVAGSILVAVKFGWS